MQMKTANTLSPGDFIKPSFCGPREAFMNISHPDVYQHGITKEESERIYQETSFQISSHEKYQIIEGPFDYSTHKQISHTGRLVKTHFWNPKRITISTPMGPRSIALNKITRA
jgi:hypothetical protein